MNIPTYAVVSLGGVTVGLSLLGWELVQWWPGRKQAVKFKHLVRLVPFLLTWFYGMLLILSAGGALGVVADWSLWGTSEIGDAVLKYGVGGTTQNVTRGSNLVLTPGGHAVVVISTVLFIGVWVKRRGFNWSLLRAILSGVSLGLSSGIAGMAGWVLSPVVSTIGDLIPGLR
ncbi:hypothetical protein [Streptomyces sp. NPDC048442]|uniref:hypothetical protein n=1 Tax=Streptomyces sp. NPDC048442 TaxID=3154823 RepID=UPI0034281DC4